MPAELIEMKKIALLVITCITLAACTDKKAQQKALLDDIIKVHDRVMGADEQLVNNKMKLDTLLKTKALTDSNGTVTALIANMNNADNAMENWMHKFDPDHTGKSADETVTYFTDQKKQIMAIDSQITAAINRSNKYLIKTKTK